ncbi:MAG: substrate-binding domain-containing protein, partial [Propionibacteriaceae bacterium]|nr:substrate-binding domain-containing protein [Propionibacteriaceae bacterium]
MKKIALVGCLALVTALIWAAGGYTLNHFEFWRAFPQIDNVVGMLPVALTVVGLGCLTAILWVAKARRRPVVVVITAFAVLSLGLFPNAVRGNWWLDHSGAGGVEAAVDLSVYAPFTGSQTAVLDIDSGLQLASDLPRLDGATAFYPIYAAIAQAVYAPEAYSPSDVVCTTTLNAFDALIVKDADVIFVLAPSAEQRAKAEAAGVELHFTPIGREAFVFLAGKTNPLDNLTTQQIRNVYSGKTAQWATLGWEEGGQIIAYQRVENSGSQSGLQRMVMAGLPIQAPQPLPKGLPKGSSS